jgi:hypothetical protein
MNAMRILNIFKRIFSPHIESPLGRWKIHNYKETTLKIKYANEDNCGLSSHNCKNIIKIHQNNELDDDDDEKYIYMMGYESAHN